MRIAYGAIYGLVVAARCLHALFRALVPDVDANQQQLSVACR